MSKKLGWGTEALTFCVWAFVVYALVASAAYRLRHPEQTETERALNLHHVLTWELFAEEQNDVE